MMDEHTTRRRVIQGAGVIGVASIAGSSVVAAQEGSPTSTPDGDTALRVTHASPDAPAVDVRLDDQTVIEGLSFGDVSDYQTVDPGTYQLQVVPAGGGDGGGLLGGILGSDQGGETVLFDQEIPVEQGTTYTAVAYGEAGQGAAATPTEGGATATDGGTTPASPEATPAMEELQAGGGQGASAQGGPLVQDLAFGDDATATVPAGDYRLLVRPADQDGGMAPADGATPADTGTPDGETAFQVALLEDDLSSPPDGQSRVRVFHAVPDVGPVNIIATPQGGGQGQGQAGGQGEGPAGGQGPPLSADVSLEAGTVYSAFATGYVDPEAAAEGTPEDGTPADTPVEGSPAGTPADGELPGFELLVVETATDGERVEGGGT